jgi:CheY-like chemotaxis protein
MVTALEGVGYSSLGAASGEEGLRVAAETPPAAVVLDLLMPEMDGFEFLTHFRRTAAGRETPVIVWTAKDLTPDEQRRLASSAQAVVLKSDANTSFLIEELQRYTTRSARRAEGAEPARDGRA